MEPEELHQLAARIARELGWRYDFAASRGRAPEHDLLPNAVIRPGLTQYGVRVRNMWQRPTHIELSGAMPTRDKSGEQRWTHSGPPPTITVRIDRGEAVLAREIRRRLLPLYEPAYAEAKAVLDRQNAYLDERERVLALLEPFGSSSRQRHDLGRVYLRGALDGVATVNSVDVRLELSVSAEDAVAVLELLTQRAKEDPPP